jgi:hypothetical protein
MTDYRDPDYRDPRLRDPAAPDYHRTGMDDGGSWSNATWGWIAGICVVVLLLIFAFGSGTDNTQTAREGVNPPATIGQRPTPPAPPAAGPLNEAPAARPAPPVTAPAPPPPAPTAPPADAR